MEYYTRIIAQTAGSYAYLTDEIRNRDELIGIGSLSRSIPEYEKPYDPWPSDLMDLLKPDKITIFENTAAYPMYFDSIESIAAISSKSSSYVPTSEISFVIDLRKMYIGNETGITKILPIGGLYRARGTNLVGPFEGSPINTVVLPSNFKTIGDWVFRSCAALNQIDFGNSIENIGSLAFSNCSSLAEISLPASITTIADDAFVGCQSLTTITIDRLAGSVSGYENKWGATNASIIWTG